MDEITEKRIERDVAKLKPMGNGLMASIERMTTGLTAADLPALIAEQQRLQPAWASNLTDTANLLLGFAVSRLRTLGAPKEYYLQLLAGVIDDNAEAVWPFSMAPAPAWLVTRPRCGNPDCTAEHLPDDRGGERDIAIQCARALKFVYCEYLKIFEADSPTATGDEVNERALACIQFQAAITMAMLPPL